MFRVFHTVDCISVKLFRPTERFNLLIQVRVSKLTTVFKVVRQYIGLYLLEMTRTLGLDGIVQISVPLHIRNSA